MATDAPQLEEGFQVIGYSPDTTTAGRLYIVAMQTLERLELQFYPQQVGVNRNPNIQEVQVPGRNLPNYHYTGGTRQMNLKLDFYSIEEHRKDVVEKVSWLESLTYNEAFKAPPQVVQLVFGDLFRNQLWVIRSLQVNYGLWHKQYGSLPTVATVDLSLSQYSQKNPTPEDVRYNSKETIRGLNR